MSLDILRITGACERIAPVEGRFAPLFCLVLLAGSCVLASLVLACATPFAAFAVIASAMLPLSLALPAVTVVWLVNQAIGFGLLGYPHEVNTLIWGVVIGLASLIATAAAKLLLRAFPRAPTPALLVFALVGAYAAYEIALFAFTPFLGGAAAFTAPIVARLGLLNLLWLIGLVGVCAAWRLVAGFRHGLAMS